MTIKSFNKVQRVGKSRKFGQPGKPNLEMFDPSPCFRTGQRTDLSFYLYGEIEEPEHYVELIHALRMAEQGEEIEIFINGVGGSMASCLAIVNAIGNSQANVTTILDGEAFSAHAFIWLSGHSKAIAGPHTAIMLHEAGYRMAGKTSEHVNQSVIIKKITNALLEDLGSWLLTPEEKSDFEKGIDVYIHGMELIDRIPVEPEESEKE